MAKSIQLDTALNHFDWIDRPFAAKIHCKRKSID
jgi:hypothetical protein